MTPVEETRNSQLFETVWQKATCSIEGLTSDETDRRFLKSLVMGGSVAAEAVVSNCQGVKRFWAESDEAKATELSQLFSFMMLSQIYRWIKQGPEQNSSAIPKEDGAKRLIHVFGSEPEQAIDDFVHFDKQYSYDLDKKQHLVHTASLLLARASEICGHKCIEWSKVKWPVVELYHLIKNGAILDRAPLRDQLDIDEMVKSLGIGMQAMTSFYSGA
jgi:hypothetical protein